MPLNELKTLDLTLKNIPVRLYSKLLEKNPDDIHE